MPFAATGMDGETVRLSKIRQRKTIMMISLICGILKKKKVKSILIETESRKVVSRGWLGGSGGEGNKGRLVKGYKLL